MADVIKLSERRKAEQQKAAAAARNAPPSQRTKRLWFIVSALVVGAVLFGQPLVSAIAG